MKIFKVKFILNDEQMAAVLADYFWIKGFDVELSSKEAKRIIYSGCSDLGMSGIKNLIYEKISYRKEWHTTFNLAKKWLLKNKFYD